MKRATSQSMFDRREGRAQRPQRCVVGADLRYTTTCWLAHQWQHLDVINLASPGRDPHVAVGGGLVKCVCVYVSAGVCVCERLCIKAGSLTEGDYSPWQARIRTMCPTWGQIWSCYWSVEQSQRSRLRLSLRLDLPTTLGSKNVQGDSQSSSPVSWVLSFNLGP